MDFLFSLSLADPPLSALRARRHLSAPHVRSLRRCRELAAPAAIALPRRAADLPTPLECARRPRCAPARLHGAPRCCRRDNHALHVARPWPAFNAMPAAAATTLRCPNLPSAPLSWPSRPPGEHATARPRARRRFPSSTPPLPAELSLPLASPKGVPPSHSAPLSFPSRAKPPQSQNALPPRHCRRRSSSLWSPYPRCPSVQIEPRNGTSSPR